MQPDGQVEGAGEGGSAPPAWEPPGDGVGKQARPVGVSELGVGGWELEGESWREIEMVEK